MNSSKISNILVIIVIIASSLIVSNRNNAITELQQEKNEYVLEIEELNSQIGALDDQISDLFSTIEDMNASVNLLQEQLNYEENLEKNTYAKVLPVVRSGVYTFDNKTGVTFSFNYSFPESTKVVCCVLDSDRITVIGYEEYILDGSGVETTTIEVRLPDSAGKWSVFPSVYWFDDDGIPNYSKENWYELALIDVIDGSPGHTQSSCMDDSAVCHSG